MIYHVTTVEEWEADTHPDHFTPAGFSSEGFIHACSQEQLAGVLSRYFSNVSNLVALSIDEYELKPELKYERGTNNELFPHIYGPINRSAIVDIQKIR